MKSDLQKILKNNFFELYFIKGHLENEGMLRMFTPRSPLKIYHHYEINRNFTKSYN